MLNLFSRGQWFWLKLSGLTRTREFVRLPSDAMVNRLGIRVGWGAGPNGRKSGIEGVGIAGREPGPVRAPANNHAR